MGGGDAGAAAAFADGRGQVRRPVRTRQGCDQFRQQGAWSSSSVGRFSRAPLCLCEQSLNPLAEMIKLLPTDNPTSKHVKDLKYQVRLIFNQGAFLQCLPHSFARHVLCVLCVQSYYVLATVEIPDDPKLVP
jgi:hypothetical protein